MRLSASRTQKRRYRGAEQQLNVRIGLGTASRTVPRIAFVGRVTERGLLEHARTQARSGSRQLVTLSGEPGIGKTRLASHAALGANADGFAVSWGACSEDLAVTGSIRASCGAG